MVVYHIAVGIQPILPMSAQVPNISCLYAHARNQRLRLAHSCILARVWLHTGACANAALLTYLLCGVAVMDIEQ